MSYRNAVVPVALLAAGLLLAACSADEVGAAQAAPTTTSSSSSSSSAATSTTAAPASADSAAYLSDLTAGGVDPAFVATNGTRLVNLGQGMCDDFRRGVSVADEAQNVTQVLLAEASYEKGLAGSPTARQLQAAQATLTIELAAEERFCPDVQPS